jgi:hypothetical protein
MLLTENRAPPLVAGRRDTVRADLAEAGRRFISPCVSADVCRLLVFSSRQKPCPPGPCASDHLGVGFAATTMKS